MELVHRPQLLPQDVHGHGLVRVQGRGGFRRRAHEDFRHSGFNLKISDLIMLSWKMYFDYFNLH